MDEHEIGLLTFFGHQDGEASGVFDLLAGNAQLLKPANVMCLECHGPKSPNGPRAPTIEAHTHHAAGTEGDQCVSCHMPKIEQTIADVNVRSHTFRFVTPEETDSLKVPNACNLCHKDKTTAWAKEALKGWRDRSTWRVVQ